MFKKNYIDAVQKDKHYLTMQMMHQQDNIRRELVNQDEFSRSVRVHSATTAYGFSLTLCSHFLYYLSKGRRKELITVLESALDKMAENILNLDEASLTSLWEKYKTKMEHFETTKEWEKSVIIFFIINAVRVKNHIFNENMLELHKKHDKPQMPPKKKPDLKLVK